MTVKQTVEITNKLGMHARPAMKLFELMQNFDAEVLPVSYTHLTLPTTSRV